MNGYSNIDAKKIPKGWRFDYLDAVATRGSGHTPDKKHPEYYNGGVKWVSLADSDKLDKVFIDSTTIEISNKGIANSSAVLHPAGTVILSRDAGVGKSAILKAPMAVSQHYITWQCKGKLNKYYLYYVLQYLKPEFERIAVGSTIKTIGMPYFKKLKILLPPFQEQKKIGQILLKYDQTSLLIEKLLQEKIQLKKALMQQLLTGKKRLKGFKGKWKKVLLGKLGEPFTGLSGKKAENFGKGKPYIPYMNVFNNSQIDISQLDFVEVGKKEAQNRVQYGDIFFTVSSETPDEVGMAAVLLSEVDEMYLNSFCFGFRLYNFKTLTPEYARFFMRSESVRKELYKLAQGSTRFNLSKGELLKIHLHIPEDVNEQIAIASALARLEDELNILNRQKTCVTEEKKGLMQQLLTGKKRVKV